MKKLTMVAAVAVLLAGLWLVGCGDDAEASACAGCGAELAAKDTQVVGDAAYCAGCATKKAEEPVTARHDCAGGCGMKDWPEDQMSEHDGQWYCKGCAAGMDDGEHDHDHDDHTGHNHG